jgi:taurine dioxygenase
VKGRAPLAPRGGLPLVVDIHGPNPAGAGVWQGGGVGFRWEDGIPMRN